MLRGSCLFPAASAGQVQPIGCPAYEVGAEPAAAVHCAAAVLCAACQPHRCRTHGALPAGSLQDQQRMPAAAAGDSQLPAVRTDVVFIIHPLDESTAPRAFACEQMLRSRAASGLGSPRVCCCGQASVVWSPFIALLATSLSRLTLHGCPIMRVASTCTWHTGICQLFWSLACCSFLLVVQLGCQ